MLNNWVKLVHKQVLPGQALKVPTLSKSDPEAQYSRVKGPIVKHYNQLYVFSILAKIMDILHSAHNNTIPTQMNVCFFSL